MYRRNTRAAYDIRIVERDTPINPNDKYYCMCVLRDFGIVRKEEDIPANVKTISDLERWQTTLIRDYLTT